MSKLTEALEAIDDFRSALFNEQDAEGPLSSSILDLNLRDVLGKLHSPLKNIHATGVGIRSKGRSIFPSEIVIKVYVYRKLPDLGGLIPGLLSRPFHGVDIDIEELPILRAGSQGQLTPQNHQARVQPIVGGVQIQLLGATHFGTLGGFVRPTTPPANSPIFALSNAHVLGWANQMSAGRQVVQPGMPSGLSFATTSMFSSMTFANNTNGISSPTKLDAALARVADPATVRTGVMLGISNYSPQSLAPVPGMKVIKSGRSSGVTRGVVKSIQVKGLTVNYGSLVAPLFAKFDDVVGIAGGNFSNFGIAGDSGSFVLEESSGCPVALLFAEGFDPDTVSDTFACDFNAVCDHFQVAPV